MIDTYKHLDKDTQMKVSLSMEEIARECAALNYGAHRLLSALVHELREKRERLAQEQERCGMTIRGRHSPLADGIEELLNNGLFY